MTYREQEEIVRGTVSGITYQNPDNGYSILRVLTEAKEQITVVGMIPLAMIGEKLMLTGRWINHPAYGKQFEAQFLERMMPESADDIRAFLSSRIIKGVGSKTAEKIVELFGARSLDVIESSPEELTQIQGISLKRAKEISESYRKQMSVRTLIEFLSAHNLPAEAAFRLFSVFGADAQVEIKRNPYLLAEDEFEVDFSLVDSFAMDIGIDGEDTRRVEAGILFELRHNLMNGHTFLPAEKLIDATVQLLTLPSDLVAASFERLISHDRIVMDTVAGLRACYLPELYEAETYTAETLLSMASDSKSIRADSDACIAQAEAKVGIHFAQAQKEAILLAMKSRLMILTGGPGTGKTTILSGILAVFDMLGLHSQLAAPTGRAAKRLSDLTGKDAVTIHRLLEVQYDSENGRLTFARNEENPLDTDVMIVDESSMVDINLISSLLHALPADCRLILVGDPDQLPSVGPGNFFSDVIRSGKIPTVRLTEIFRQARESLIVMNAHAVNRGDLPRLDVKNRDFFFIRKTSPEDAVETVRDLCVRRLPQKLGILPEEVQVLTPTRKNTCGTVNLNRILQASVNPPEPGKKEKKFGDYIFREGDRVMQIRNNYDIMWKHSDGIGVGLGIFNGDVGTIQTISYEEETATILFDERIADYSFDMLSELEPAYAMTVHKSQGSEYRAVVFAAVQGSPLLLSRSVLYTALTRAKELLIIVGDENVISYMVNNNKKTRRYSGLKLRLENR